MTWVDLVVIGVVALSALVAFARGFVREVLGIAAWVCAAFVSIWAFPYVAPKFRGWISEADIADPAAFISVFFVALIILSIVSRWIAALVALSPLGGVDRTLGLLFGLLRGALLVVAAYIAAGMVVPVGRWPEPVLEARLLMPTYHGAKWVVDHVPPPYQPNLQPPPQGRQPAEEDLLRATPQGRATGKPVGN
jgi:membrane protein required for colicin V production